MDKRTQAEKDRTRRNAAAIRAAARTPEQKLAGRSDAEDRFGGTTIQGKPVTDAVFDDPTVAGNLAEHLDAREHPKVEDIEAPEKVAAPKVEDPKVEDEDEKDERDDECEDPKTHNRPAESNRRASWRTF